MIDYGFLNIKQSQLDCFLLCVSKQMVPMASFEIGLKDLTMEPATR